MPSSSNPSPSSSASAGAGRDPAADVESRIGRRLLLLGVAFAAAYGILVLGFGQFLSRRLVRAVERDVVAEATSVLHGLSRDLDEPEKKWLAKGGGDPVAARVRLLESTRDRNELFLSIRIKASDGNVIVDPPVRLKAGDPRIGSEAFGTPIEAEISKDTLLVASLARSTVDRRTEFVRSEVTTAVAGVLAGGGLVLFVVLWLLWRDAESSRREVGARIHEARLAEVGALAAGLAHEIRNPLNSLRLNVQLIEEDLRAEAGRPGVDDNLRLTLSVRREIERLESLLADFLQYARPRLPAKRECDVVGLVKGVVESLGPELESESIRVEVDAPSSSPRVPLDEGQLTQVLVNLVRNAKEALVARPPTDRRIRIEVASEGADWLRIAVADSGPGVDAAELSKLGDLFYSTKKGGTGLGLPIARRVAEEHGGQVRFESSPGRGLRVVIRLPRR